MRIQYRLGLSGDAYYLALIPAAIATTR